MKNKRKKRELKPNFFAWQFYLMCTRVYCFFTQKIHYHIKSFKKRDKKVGCIILYNHDSNHDHFIMTNGLGCERANYVMAKHFYYTKALATVLPWVKAIPREQFKADTVSIRKMKRAVMEGGIVPIAPAGQITPHGVPMYIDPSIVKLLKFCNCDVYAFNIKGNYFAYPKWTDKSRKMAIDVYSEHLFTPSDLKNLTEEELYDRTCESIYTNDREETPKRVIPGKRLSEGLEKILYVCPICHKKYTIKTLNNDCYCESCGYKVSRNKYGEMELNSSGKLIFKNEYEWYIFQKELIKEELRKNNVLLNNEFELILPNKEDTKLLSKGSGKVVLTKDSFYYEGLKDGEAFRKDFDLSKIWQLSYTCDHRFNVPDTECTYEFWPTGDTNPHVIMEYVQTIDAIRELNSEVANEQGEINN